VATVQFGILGPLTVRSAAGEPVIIGGPRPRALLALLLLDAGHLVSTDRLIDGLYGATPPPGAANALQSQVSRLRRTLRTAGAAEHILEFHPAGYRLAVDPDQVDSHRFGRLAAEGRQALAAGDQQFVADLLREALDLWRGPALGDLADAPFAGAARARLDQQRLAAVEDHAEAELALGNYAEVLDELQEAVAANPLRERPHAQLMRALHGLGRTAQALTVFADIRRGLAEELGADPATELAETHLAILRAPTRTPMPAPSRGLPAQLASFVGRDADLADLATALDTVRLVTLVGPGGVGKTRLAVEAGARYSGEVCFVELAPLRRPGGVALAILGALGLREAPLLPAATGQPDVVERLTAALAERSLLIVLDNCEHLVAEAAHCVHELLRGCPRLRVLATSREPLAITGETLRPVLPLPVPPAEATVADTVDYPAARLYIDRAVAVVPDFVVDKGNLAALHRICTALDGLPLAIELAAARLRALSITEIADRLDDRFRLLTRGSRTAAPRHQTLRAVVEWSWDLLAEPARQLASRLAVFAGGATLDAVAAVCGLPRARAEELLADLVGQSLVDSGAGRYRMLETIRAFCAEQLLTAGEEPGLRRAHAEYFLALATATDPHLRRAEQLTWLAALTAEHDNLRTALHWSVPADPPTALRLIGALSWYWYLRGVRSEVAATAADLLTVLGTEPPAELGEEYVLCVLHTVLSGTADQAHRARVEALMGALRGPVRQPFLVVAWGLTNGPPAELDEHGLLPIMRSFLASPDPWCPAISLLSISFTRWFAEGDLDTAEAECLAALTAFRELGERWGLAQTVEALAMFADARGEVGRAIALTDEALDLVGQLGAGEELADMRCRRADRLLRTGDLAAAQADYQRAADLARTGRLRVTHILARSGLGEVARLRGDRTTARRLQEAALHDCGTDWLSAGARARVLGALGRLAETEGDLAEAVRLHRAAVTVASANRNLHGLATAVTGLACALSRTDDPDSGEADHAVRLLGLAAAILDTGVGHDPDLARTVERLTTALGAQRYAELFDSSAALPRPTAVAALTEVVTADGHPA
jgi:predicted ATPase/DNA-binding SARP family transcriptional activator